MKLEKILKIIKELIISILAISIFGFLGFKSVGLIEAGSIQEGGLLMILNLFVLVFILIWGTEE